MEEWDIVIVGAGIAGVSAVRTLVVNGYKGRVLLINAERTVPYKRTKLSKHIADGSKAAQFALEQPDWYEHNDVTLKSSASVRHIDASAHEMVLADGSRHRYKKMILATGARPAYPKATTPESADSLLVVRSEQDIENLRKAVKRSKRVLVVGMGVLAVEVAAELRRMKKQVTLAGATAQLMPRHLNPRTAEILEDLLRGHDIKLKFSEEVLKVEPRRKGGVSVTMLRDTLRFDAAVLCVGVKPDVALAEDAGLEINRGIRVNDRLQTSNRDIYAAGDCAEHADGSVTDLWHAAEYQGEIAARNASGEQIAYDGLLFRLKLEVFDSYFFSMNKPRDPLAVEIVESEIGKLYQCFFFEEGELTGAIMVNDKERAKEYQQAVRESWEKQRVLEHFDRAPLID